MGGLLWLLDEFVAVVVAWNWLNIVFSRLFKIWLNLELEFQRRRLVAEVDLILVWLLESFCVVVELGFCLVRDRDSRVVVSAMMQIGGPHGDSIYCPDRSDNH